MIVIKIKTNDFISWYLNGYQKNNTFIKHKIKDIATKAMQEGYTPIPKQLTTLRALFDFTNYQPIASKVIKNWSTLPMAKSALDYKKLEVFDCPNYGSKYKIEWV